MKKFNHTRHLLAALMIALSTPTVLAQGAADLQAPTTLSETYDAWTVQCVNRADGENTQRICQMTQELLQQNTRQRVLTFAIGRSDQGSKATLILPFGLLLSDGVRIKIAEEEILQGAFRTCLPAGCVVEVDVSDDAIQKLEAAPTASILMTSNTGQPVKTDVSLQGFASAFQRLSALAGVENEVGE